MSRVSSICKTTPQNPKTTIISPSLHPEKCLPKFNTKRNSELRLPRQYCFTPLSPAFIPKSSKKNVFLYFLSQLKTIKAEGIAAINPDHQDMILKRLGMAHSSASRVIRAVGAWQSPYGSPADSSKIVFKQHVLLSCSKEL